MLLTIVRITETWLDSDSSINFYNTDGYKSYFCNRASKAGSDVMILIDSSLHPLPVSHVHSFNDTSNVVAVNVGHWHNRCQFAAVYKAPWATYNDTKELCLALDKLVVKK